MDCIVIGGGIIGCSIAWELARAGRRVAIFEASSPGSEASGAAAGMLAPGGEFDSSSPLARNAVESLAMYPAFVRSLAEETGVDIDFRVSGALELPCAPSSDLVQRAEKQRVTLGIAAQIRADGSVFYVGDALVDPRHVMRSLIAACKARGVEMIEQHTVRDVGADMDGVAVEHLHARTAVIAAGAWSSTIRVGSRPLPHTFPVRGHLLGYWLEPGLLPHIVRRGHFYVFQRSNGYLVTGSDTARAGFDRGPDPGRVEEIRNAAETLIPALAGTRPDDVWTGFRPGTESGQPHICRFHPRVWLAYGHYRNGILLAPHTARAVTSEIIASLETD